MRRFEQSWTFNPPDFRRPQSYRVIVGTRPGGGRNGRIATLRSPRETREWLEATRNLTIGPHITHLYVTYRGYWGPSVPYEERMQVGGWNRGLRWNRFEPWLDRCLWAGKPPLVN
ncbi:hypothetical protein SAMN05445060_2759 [Williamsia sterculiae]|uniref:Uncharacterized protein n=1 Tax=Williamsia sterculiae TaxID=1344003 RepID=A0A1N7GGQ5_9NOCA|nr:hypothetical protein SAMN05445060_2759 [Williamsia sterculiae]